MPYLSASAVVIHYEEVLYMYAPLPSVCTFSGSGSSGVVIVVVATAAADVLEHNH